MITELINHVKKYGYLIAVIVGVALGAASMFFVTRPDPRPGKMTVVENPSSKQVEQATAAVKATGQGNLSGSAPWVTPSPPGQIEDVFPTPSPFYASAEIPVTGEIKTTYTNAKTGDIIGAGTHPISGLTTVSIEDSLIKADTTFDNDFTLAIDMPEPSPKRWAVGVMAGVGEVGKDPWHGRMEWSTHVQYDLTVVRTKSADFAIPLRVEYNCRDKLRMVVGFEIRV